MSIPRTDPFDPLGIRTSPISAVNEHLLSAYRIQEGLEQEKQFRTMFERFLFDLSLEPSEAERRTVEALQIIEKHKAGGGR